MAADNFTANLTLQYTPPGAPANSGVAAIAVAGNYQAGQAGTIDVPNGTVVGTVFAVPFGSVSAAKLLVVKNGMSSDVGVRLNGAVANEFKLSPGAMFAYSAAAAPDDTPMASVSFVTTADPGSTERVQYWCMGD